MSQIRGLYAYSAVFAVLILVSQSGCQSLAHRFGKHGANNNAPPDGLSKSNVADDQMRLARSLEKERKTDEAMRVYTQVAAEHGLSRAYHRLAVLHDQRGQFDKSVAAYKKALAQDPRNAELLCDVGYSYYLQRRWAESEHFLKSALAESPQLPRARNNHGLLLARQGRVEEALHQFSLAGCTEPEARVNLAFAMTLEDNTDDAQRQLELALNRDRNCRPARQLLAAIEGPEKVASAVPPSGDKNNEDPVSRRLESSVPVRLSEPLGGNSVNVSHAARADEVRRDDSLGSPHSAQPARHNAINTPGAAAEPEDDRFRIPAAVVSQSAPIVGEQTEPAVRWKSAGEPAVERAVEPPLFQ
jgi:tetratricopeptide (TPR) repeat protein